VRQELKYNNDNVYYVLGGGIGQWDYGLSGWAGFADTSEAMRHAFAKNPFMQVYVAEGYYDAATPYFAAEYTFGHMGLTADEHKNLTRGLYSAGHMVYIDGASMDKLHADVDSLFERTIIK
jgi:carboxypeptidase C (cathepsin A)